MGDAKPKTTAKSSPGKARRAPAAIKKPRAGTTKAAAKAPTPSRRRISPVDDAAVRGIFSAFQQVNPEPKGELEYVNPFTLLVAVVLSAQAT
ncbi:MAG: endonuclease III, partial [Beijerinckiaceae bacterium]